MKDCSDIARACVHTSNIRCTFGAVSSHSIAHTQPLAVRANGNYCAGAQGEEIDRKATDGRTDRRTDVAQALM